MLNACVPLLRLHCVRTTHSDPTDVLKKDAPAYLVGFFHSHAQIGFMILCSYTASVERHAHSSVILMMEHAIIQIER